MERDLYATVAVTFWGHILELCML